MRHGLLILIALLGVTTCSASPPPGMPLTCAAMPRLFELLFDQHVQVKRLDADLERRVIDSYLRRIDPSRALLTASEAEATRLQLNGLLGEVAEGNCQRIEAVHVQMAKRYIATERLVRGILARPDFAIDKTTRLNIDPEQRGYAKDEAEFAALQRKLVDFQLSNYLASGIAFAEAKTQLVHRYELSTKNAVEASLEDQYATFLDAFATALDPHTNYLSADDLEDFQILMRLSLEGIGAELSSRDGYITVMRLVPGGPAELQGILKPEDKIVAVAQEGGEPVSVIDTPLRDVVRMIRGKKGTRVRLTVLRQASAAERLTVTIVRDRIKLEEQAAALRFETRRRGQRQLKLAVLELPSFYGDPDPNQRQSWQDVERLLRQAKAEKADGLLFDLAENGGGMLEHAINIAGFFVREGGMVAVRDAKGEIDVLDDPDDSVLFAGPLVVLTSRLSASASEIVAGAMKDYRRGVVVGDRATFGKGSVQTMVPLPPRLGALKVTTATFYRPGGRSTQSRGVEADIILPSITDSDEIGEETVPYALPPSAIAPFASERANEVKGKLAYRPLSAKLRESLAAKSAARVAKSAAFSEIRKQAEEAKRKRGVVDLSEVEKETEPDRRPAGKEREPSAQQLEALEILADLIAG